MKKSTKEQIKILQKKTETERERKVQHEVAFSTKHLSIWIRKKYKERKYRKRDVKKS